MRWVHACVLVLAGCFADAPDLEDGGGTTGSAPCPVGSRGCPCTSGGACDAPLECHAQSQHCYDPDCVLGAAQCPCADGVCFTDHVCIDGYCQPEPVGSTGPSDTGGTSTTSADATSTGFATATSPETGSESQSASDPTLDTGEVATTEPPSCVDCLWVEIEGDCEEQWDACIADDVCNTILQCVLAGSEPAQCCSLLQAESIQWGFFATCVQVPCGTTCGGGVSCGA